MNALASIDAVTETGRPFVIDGGLGSELMRRGQDIASHLWSAQLLISDPGVLRAVHRAYLDAGARCITAASYQASVDGFRKLGLEDSEIERLMQSSVEIAIAARDAFVEDNPDCGYRPLVAASIGPYGAFLADGSEYRGNYAIDEAALRRFHRQRLAWLDASDADLLACETIPDLVEARVLADLLKTATTPAWVSFSCRNGTDLNDGHPLADAIEWFRDHPRVFALGVNCTDPQWIDSLIGVIAAARLNRKIVVYPNGGAAYDAACTSEGEGESPEDWSQRALEWYRAGADIIGGCCQVGPHHIQRLAAEEQWRY